VGDGVNGLLEPANGTVSVDPVTGEVTYTPDADFFGTDTFEYQVCDDDGACDTAVVTVDVLPVEDAPDAQPDVAVTDEDLPVVVYVLANDTDPESNLDPTSVTVGDGVNGLLEPANGTVTVDPVTGEITYTPDADFSGTDTFEYQVCDLLGNCSVTTVTVTVNAVNDAPVAVDDATSTPEDTPVNLDVRLDNGAGADSDVDVASSTATGASFTGFTVTVTVAISHAPSSSQTWYSKVSVPEKSASGV